MAYRLSNLYVMRSPLPGATHAVTVFSKADGWKKSDPLRCSRCGAAMSMLRWMPPFRAEIEFHGEHHGDIGFFVGELLVSQRLVDAYAQAELTGLEVIGPAEIVSVTPPEMVKGMPKYCVARVHYSKAVFDDVASEAEYERRWTCRVCRTAENILRYKRVVLEDGTWSGEDVFHAIGLPGVILTSERFKEFCERHAFKNVHLVPGSEYSVDWYPGWNPGEEEG
jgi:hypothetical protein